MTVTAIQTSAYPNAQRPRVDIETWCLRYIPSPTHCLPPRLDDTVLDVLFDPANPLNPNTLMLPISVSWLFSCVPAVFLPFSLLSRLGYHGNCVRPYWVVNEHVSLALMFMLMLLFTPFPTCTNTSTNHSCDVVNGKFQFGQWSLLFPSSYTILFHLKFCLRFMLVFNSMFASYVSDSKSCIWSDSCSCWFSFRFREGLCEYTCTESHELRAR